MALRPRRPDEHSCRLPKFLEVELFKLTFLLARVCTPALNILQTSGQSSLVINGIVKRDTSGTLRIELITSVLFVNTLHPAYTGYLSGLDPYGRSRCRWARNIEMGITKAV